MEADNQNTPQDESVPPLNLEHILNNIMQRMEQSTAATEARMAILEASNAAMQQFIQSNLQLPLPLQGTESSANMPLKGGLNPLEGGGSEPAVQRPAPNSVRSSEGLAPKPPPPHSQDTAFLRGGRDAPPPATTGGDPNPNQPFFGAEPPRVHSQRKPLQMGEPFSGAKASFKAWQVTMVHKLNSDAVFIGTTRDMFAFIWSQLSLSVQREVAPFYEIGGHSETWNPHEFLEYLEFCYSDNHGRERAQTKLEELRQGANESFSDFFVRFEQLLVQSGGSKWDSEQRLLKLRRALNQRIRGVAMNRGVTRTDYDEAVRAYKSIAVDVETMAIEDKMRPQPGAQSAPRRDPDGDVAMTTVSAATIQPSGSKKTRGRGRDRKGAQGATWVPDEVYQQRIRASLCTRCGGEGHIRRDCPNAVETTVRAVHTTKDDEVDSEEGKSPLSA